MKQNDDFQEGVSPAYSIAIPLLNPKFLTTNESFQMRYYVWIFFKGYENYQGSNIKISKNSLFIKQKLCPLAILMPLKENPHIVPHLKALISC